MAQVLQLCSPLGFDTFLVSTVVVLIALGTTSFRVSF